jgi:aspartyl-tRNA synthetase
VEDVDYYFEVIEDNPLARRKTVDRGCATIVVVAQARFDLIGNGFELGLGTGRANDKEIGEAGDAGKIQNDDVFGLFI